MGFASQIACPPACVDDFGGTQTPFITAQPCLTAMWMEDPRLPPGSQIPVLAFYFAGKNEWFDEACQAGFLGNFWPCQFKLTPPLCTETPQEGAMLPRDVLFSNSESAFQALKWWRTHALQFASTSGAEAFSLKKKLAGSEDRSYGGFGGNWAGMAACLRAKFCSNESLKASLLATADAFLLEHNTKPGRDSIWSDNHTGDGTNFLGLQLMLLREELRESHVTGRTREQESACAHPSHAAASSPTSRSSAAPAWSDFIATTCDCPGILDPAGPGGKDDIGRWQAVVLRAAAAVFEAEERLMKGRRSA